MRGINLKRIILKNAHKTHGVGSACSSEKPPVEHKHTERTSSPRWQMLVEDKATREAVRSSGKSSLRTQANCGQNFFVLGREQGWGSVFGFLKCFRMAQQLRTHHAPPEDESSASSARIKQFLTTCNMAARDPRPFKSTS